MTTIARRKYRPGFEPDKSTGDWMGRHVRTKPNSGGWDGERGVVIKVETSHVEFGWFEMLFDNEALREKFPDGMLMHSTEVDLLPNDPAVRPSVAGGGKS